jgi:hypothetical protein
VRAFCAERIGEMLDRKRFWHRNCYPTGDECRPMEGPKFVQISNVVGNRLVQAVDKTLALGWHPQS